MTTTFATVNVRMTPEQRRMREKARRRQQLAYILYTILCGVQRAVARVKEAKASAPARLKELAVNSFGQFVCIALFCALFFAVLGVLTLAIDFFVSVQHVW